MIPAEFGYERAESVEHALDLLGSAPEAKVLAGGHSLVPALKLRIARPGTLVDIGRLTGLAYVRDAGTHLAIGALTRHDAVHHDPLLQEHCPIVSTAAGMIGDPQVRHRGTIGGSLAHGDPASDLPAVVLALRGSIVARGPQGERTIAADDFFVDFLETALAPDEIITEVRVPKTNGAGWSFQKFNRRAQDWAIVGVAAVGGDTPGVALVNMGSKPLRAATVEDAMRAGASVEDAAAHAADDTEPPSDLNASVEYRQHLARVLVRRALTSIDGTAAGENR